MDKLPVISVLGCGWFGLPMAVELIRNGYKVKGSTTSLSKLDLLSERQIVPYLVQFEPELPDTSFNDFFKCDILLINIPPKGETENYLTQMKAIIRFAESNAVKQVFFISSTSVYGNSNKEVTEEDECLPDTSSGKVLLACEKIFRSSPFFNTTIVRFGGLIGPGRHPGKFLAGKKGISNGLAPVNLIHLDDCIGIVLAAIRQEAFGIILNACSPDHPSRKEFYTRAAKEIGLEIPEFLEEKKEWKLVQSLNIQESLNYSFKVLSWNSLI